MWRPPLFIVLWKSGVTQYNKIPYCSESHISLTLVWSSLNTAVEDLFNCKAMASPTHYFVISWSPFSDTNTGRTQINIFRGIAAKHNRIKDLNLTRPQNVPDSKHCLYWDYWRFLRALTWKNEAGPELTVWSPDACNKNAACIPPACQESELVPWSAHPSGCSLIVIFKCSDSEQRVTKWATRWRG